MIKNQKDNLWPFSKVAAFLLVPLIWLMLTLGLSVTQRYLGWPGGESQNLVFIVVLVAGFVPLILVLLDFFAGRGAILSYKGMTIDFSRIDLSHPEVRQESFGLQDNIGISGPIMSDTSPMEIIEQLRKATRHEIVIIDMRDGNAWWVTRLLALSAGAVRNQSPRAMVFVGKQENQDHRFLGWAAPSDVLSGILKSNEEYGLRFQRAKRIARQVVMYGANEFLPQQPQPFYLNLEVQRYTNLDKYTKLGDAVEEQIIMDQLAYNLPTSPSLEEKPERLTVGKLNDLFGHCLYRSIIDLSWPNEKQISCFLDSKAPYIALVRGGEFESMLKYEDGERLILREVIKQLQRTAKPKA